MLLGNNKFAYSFEGITDDCGANINIFARESSGALELAPGQNVNYPEGPAGGYYYYAMFPSDQNGAVGKIATPLITDDGSNHLADRTVRDEGRSLWPDEEPTAGQL